MTAFVAQQHLQERDLRHFFSQRSPMRNYLSCWMRFLRLDRYWVPLVAAILWKSLIFSNRIPGLHRRLAHASADPTCTSLDANVTCRGDGELLSEHVQESGVYRAYTHAKVEDGITIIGAKCFYGCKLQYIELPSTLIEIKDCAFQDTRFVTFTIGKLVTTINAAAWNGCRYLTHFYVESGNSKFTASNGFLFQNGNLCNVGGGRGKDAVLTLPDCTTILSNAIRRNFCTEIVISDTTTTIQGTAFYASSFTKVTLGKKVSSISVRAFLLCTKLVTIDLNGNTNFYLENGIFGEKNTNGKPTSISWFSDTVTSVTIAKTVKSIGGGGLQYRSGITYVSVESGHTTFGIDCDNQLVVDTKSNNKWTRACHCVGGATSITIPSNIKTIADGCFWKCGLLTSITLHSGVNCFGDTAFQDCGRLESIDFRGCTMKDTDGKDMTGHNMMGSCTSLTTIVNWPSNSFETAEGTFGGCGFTVLELPEQLTLIGRTTFMYCHKLEVVVIPKTVTSIGVEAFLDCNRLVNVTFAPGSTLTSIQGMSFAQCTRLNRIVLPHTITEMNGNTFALCTGLTEISFNGESDTFLSEDGAVYRKSGGNKHYTFYICPASVTAIVLHPETVEIGANSFYGCSNITDVIMNNNLVRIETNAFVECNSIRVIRIPGTVSYIGKRAFVLCMNLHSIMYCSENDTIEYNGNPFPSNPAIYLIRDASGDKTTCRFCDHECKRVLDTECHLSTSSFTFRITVKHNRLCIYAYTCTYAATIAKF